MLDVVSRYELKSVGGKHEFTVRLFIPKPSVGELQELVPPTAVSFNERLINHDQLRNGYDAIEDTKYEKRYEWKCHISEEMPLRVMINYRLVKERSDNEVWTSLVPTERLDLTVDMRHPDEFEWHVEPLHKGELRLLNEVQGRGLNHFVHTTAINVDIIFGRLYYHLSQKYSYDYMTITGKKEVILFALDQIPGKRHCVQFPLMASVLASLTVEHDRFLINTRLSIIALLFSLLSLVITLID